MTSNECTPSTCPGYYRGTANVGWSGSKLFVLEFDMPGGNDRLDKPPAIWALNGEVVRSAQYGCNCRGMGGEDDKGGCGELDILENIEGAPNNGISELYRQVFSRKLTSFSRDIDVLTHSDYSDNILVSKRLQGAATMIISPDHCKAK